MSGSGWRIEDAERQPTPQGVAETSLVSLHYLRAALRRRWKVVAAAAVAGLLIAAGILAFAPRDATASATVLLAHDPSVDAGNAMDTDVSLLTTRTVANQVISKLSLRDVTADDLLSSVTTEQASSQVLEVDLTAPSDSAAVARLGALTDEFLQFRNAQLGAQADDIVEADKARIDTLQQQIDTINTEYEGAIATGDRGSAQRLLGRRTELTAQIGALQETISDTALQADSLARASHVVDPAALVPVHNLRRIAFGLVSGLVGGTGVGVALVFVTALISNRLRRRDDVAMALGHSVRFSAGPVHSRLPLRRGRQRRNLDRLAAGLESALDSAESPSLILASAGDTKAAALVLARAARNLAGSGKEVFLVDLTTTGALSERWTGTLPVHRPDQRPELADGPLSVVTSSMRLSERDPRREQMSTADAVLVLADVELGMGTSHLATWSERAVVLVAAGRTTAEFLRSTRQLFRDGPSIRFAMLVGSDSSDESVGAVPADVRDDDRPSRQAR